MSGKPQDVCCPRCGCVDLHRFGKDPATGLQRFRCKNAVCRRQFVPGKPTRPRKYPKVICPRCGSNMGIFKILSDCLRFRCNRYRAAPPKRCTHKVNIPFPGKQVLDVVTDPAKIRLIEGKLPVLPFHWSRMKFTPHTVALALYFSFFRAMPAPAVVDTLRDLYQIRISHDTVTRWSHKAAFLLSDRCNQMLEIPSKKGRKPRLFLDETQRKVRGKKRWFWLAYVRRYDLYLGRNLSARRDTRAARDTLAMTFQLAPPWKNADLLTDGLWSYGSALGDLRTDGKHIVYNSFFEEPNNNALERKWSNFHMRARPFRGFKSDLGQAAFNEAQIVYHNVFKRSSALGGQTPYEALGVRVPAAPNDWMRLTRLLTC